MANYFVHPQALCETDQIGEGTRVWAFAHVMKGVVIGKGCNICGHCFIEGGVVIGNNVTVKNGISIWEKVSIEDDVFLGPNMVFTNVIRPRSGARGNFVETLVKRGATIGANATIVCGVTIGAHAMVGAGAVVTREVRPYSLIYGSPARHKGYVCRCAEKLEFGNKKTAVCQRCNASYLLKKGCLIIK